MAGPARNFAVQRFSRERRAKHSPTERALALLTDLRLPPGDYKVFAWEVVEANAWTDPDFLRSYENNGAAVRISEGGRGAADVQVIPYKAN